MLLPPAVAGSITALSWGSADFIARFTSRGLGLIPALFWMLASSAAILTLVSAWGAPPETGLTAASGATPLALLLLGIYGVGVTAATVFLYHALAMGPVTIAAPIVGSFPAFNLLVAFALGTRPSPAQWLAMALVMIGVAVVARSAGHFEQEHTYDGAHLRRTVLASVAAAMLFGVSVSAGQEAGAAFGDLSTVCAGRWIGVALCLVLLLWRRDRLSIPRRWWPIVTVQGVLDGTAYVTLLLGSEGAASPIAPVIGSAFSVVTVVLARIFIQERMSVPQWLGIMLVICGVGMLSAG